MNLIKLSITDKELKRYNDHIDNVQKANPDIDFSSHKAATVDELFCPYKIIINDEDWEKYLDKLVYEDNQINLDGVYFSNIVDMLDTKIDEYSDYKLRQYPYDYIGTFETEIISPYGVCDNVTQAINYFKDFEKRTNIDLGDCIILMQPIIKEFQESDGGWRWHKWGRYIGVKEPQYEYIADEDDSIKSVWCFNIYLLEKK